MGAKSIANFFDCGTKFKGLSMDEMILRVGGYLTGCAKGLFDLVGDDYRLMLTGGKDSRLSLHSMLLASNGRKVKTFTHAKPPFCNDRDDLIIPKQIRKTANVTHNFTVPSSALAPFDWEAIALHDPVLSKEKEPGSTAFYYRKGNWLQIEERYLIDNYYETGRMHLHGKGHTPTARHLTLENIKASGFQIDEGSFQRLQRHLESIGTGCDLLDVFYFVKNYANVANQFGLIDFSHNPLIFCNSRSLFCSLLSVPEHFRKDGFFHFALCNCLASEKIRKIPYNPSAKIYFWRLIKKMKSKISFFMYNRN